MREGVTLSNYYGQSLCTPARAALHSGKFVHRTGFSSLFAEREVRSWSNYSLSLSNKLIGQRMSALGYTSVYGGKWNIGHCNSLYTPVKRGYHDFIGCASEHKGEANVERTSRAAAAPPIVLKQEWSINHLAPTFVGRTRLHTT